jgi:hypothetical protein
MISATRCMCALVVAAVAVSHAQPTRPVVSLNHFYVIPDSATYAAISESRFIRDTFGIFEARTTKRADQTYTGIYWYGTATYFEMLPPGAGGRKVGDSGVAWGTDSPADTARLRTMLARIPRDSVTVNLITRGVDSGMVPWFTQTALASAGSRAALVTWVMTYAPRFLDDWFPELPPLRVAPTRDAVQERYAARVNGHARRDSVSFGDVRALRVAVTTAERTGLLAECRALGMRVTPASCHADDGFILTFVDATAAKRGVQRITMALRREWPGPRERVFGSSRLRIVAPRRAEWSIGRE